MVAETAPNRLVSLDVFRGMTIAGMVLVNNPGTWSAIYSPLEHAPWHGITPTDFIFPFFLFIVGVAIPIALSKRIAEGIDRKVYFKIFSRAAIIFGLGLFMAAFPVIKLGESDLGSVTKLVLMLATMAGVYFWLIGQNRVAVGCVLFLVIAYTAFALTGSNIRLFDPTTLRIPGVLQRIAVCYAIVSVLFLHFNWKQLTAIGIVALFAYWFLMTWIPVPGCEVTTIDDKACNLAAWLDIKILTGNHIWKQAVVYDPEGILSTIPACVTTISGVLTGMWLRTEKSETEKAGGILFFGVVLCAIGWCWNFFFPYNKALWTSSYVCYTSGLALCFLGFCYWLIDIKGYTRWTKPFVIFGMNALALFVFSGLVAKSMANIKFTGAEGKSVSLQGWIFNNIFLPLASPINASLAFAISFILFFLFLMWLLYRKKIWIKV